jgi:cytochrome P450
LEQRSLHVADFFKATDIKQASIIGLSDILDAQQAYFMPLMEERRRNPGDDMISAMARAEVGGERLTDLEILAT